MSWTDLPTVSGATNLQAWPLWSQIDAAIRERYDAAGTPWFPSPSRTWGAAGAVPAGITATGFTDAAYNDGDGWCPTSTIPWTCQSPTDPTFVPQIPTTWYLVIDSCGDPTEIVVTRVTGIPSTTSITFDDISDQITAGYPDSLAALEGRPYYFIGWAYHVWWHERIMGGTWQTTPNDYEWATGQVREYHDDPDNPSSVTNPTHASIKDDDRKHWQPGEHVGRDLLVYDTTNKLRRVAVTGNTTNVATFTTQTWTPALNSPYVIVSSGARAVPGKQPLHPYVASSSASTSHPSHDADDTLGSAYVPLSLIHVEGPNDVGTGCDGFDVQGWDFDHFNGFPLSPDELSCGEEPDKPANVKVWASMRGRQLAIERVAGHFVEAKDYEDEPWVPLLNEAALFKAISLNTYETTIVSVDGVGSGHTSNTLTLDSFAPPVSPHNIYWAVVPLNGRGEYKSGTGLLSTDNTLVAYSSNGADNFDDRTDVGCTIFVSYGWNRPHPREFKHMHPASCWIPDEVTIDGVRGVIDPAATNFDEDGCLGTGKHVRRPASTHYIDRNTHAASWSVDAVGPAKDGAETFVTGELARLVGDNYRDPTVTGFGGEFVEADDPQKDAFDHFYDGKAAPPTQKHLDGQLRGRASKGSTTSLTDPRKDWFDFGWFSGIVHTESGTSTGGSSTSLTDSSKGTGEAACWWDAGRFIGFDAPYVGFTVEVLLSGSGFDAEGATVEKRLITSCSAAGSIAWTTPMTSSVSGHPYRIKEPRRLNRYEGRRLYLRRRDPDTGELQTATTTILGNDATTLFFDAIPWAVDKHTTYRIIEPIIGGVYRWTGTAWELPTGDDSSRYGVSEPQPFKRDPRCNLPTVVKRYGKTLPGDYVGPQADEMRAALNALVWTRTAVIWDNPDSLPNTKSAGQYTDSNQYDDGSAGWAEFWGDGVTILVGTPSERYYPGVQTAWDVTSAYVGDNGAPYSSAVGTNEFAGTRVGGYTKHTNLARINVPLTRCGLASEADYWVYCTIEPGDHDEGDECTGVVNLDEHGNPYTTHSYAKWYFDGSTTHENVKFRACHKWDGQTSPSTDLTRYSSFLGDDIEEHLPQPPDPADTAGTCLVNPGPPSYDYLSSITAGWYAAHAWAVVRWDVAGGFSYVE